jgi:hypothetical protein
MTPTELQTLLQKVKTAKQINIPSFSSKAEELTYLLKFTPKMLIQAPPGRLIVACDFASQELFIAAILSGDPTLLQSFLPDSPESPDLIPVPPNYAGIYQSSSALGANPYKDLHTLAGKQSYPDYFQDAPEYLWCAIARSQKVIGENTIRDIGKIINYGSLYLQSPKAMSQLHNVPLKVAERWIKGYKNTFPVLEEWKQRISGLGTARGWMNDELGRVRWCKESNSGGKDNATERLAVNHTIQGLAASQTKLACCNVLEATQGTDLRFLGQIHDEILVEVPGEWWYEGDLTLPIDLTKLKTSPESNQYVQLVKTCMEEAQRTIFKKIRPNHNYEGKADGKIAPYWLH